MLTQSRIHTIVLCIYLLHVSLCFCNGNKTVQDYFGVMFHPYIKQPENGEFPKINSYTLDNIKTMLTVVSTRFSRILLEDPFSLSDRYIYNSTYYNDSFISVRTAEVAATINRRNDNKNLSVMFYISVSEVDTMLAFEAAENANKIYRNTVEGLFLKGDHENFGELEQTLKYLRTFKEKASRLGILLGTSLECVNSISSQNISLQNVFKQIANESDMILCSILEDEEESFGGFIAVASQLQKFKNYVHGINKETKIFGATFYIHSEVENGETIQNRKQFWDAARTWSFYNKFPIYLAEAFDNPYPKEYPLNSHMGWWKLKDNSQINMIEGYIEKISANVSESEGHSLETSGNHVIIGVAVIVGMVLIGSVALLAFLYTREKQSSALSAREIREFIAGTSRKHNDADESSALVETAMRAPYDRSLEIQKNLLKIEKSHLLGSGAFGCVFKAQLFSNERESEEVAVKMTKEDCPSSALKGLLAEIKVMSYLGDHPNIVGLKGAYTAELSRGVVYVVMELCKLGSLEGFLRRNKLSMGTSAKTELNTIETPVETLEYITFQDMVRWSYEIACGMHHLEKKHVVHADLAARNVLLTCEKTAKIADFGLSRRMYNYQNYVKTQQEPLPWRWMAIESLERLEFSSKSDVWAYGITLWEIFSKGNIPYQGLGWTQGFANELLDGLRPERPSNATSEIYRMMRRCWHSQPNERPDFEKLVECTEAFVQNFTPGEENEALKYLCLREVL